MCNFCVVHRFGTEKQNTHTHISNEKCLTKIERVQEYKQNGEATMQYARYILCKCSIYGNEFND